MREVMAELVRGWRAGEAMALATVVETNGSAPRRPGACMIVKADGEVVGSVSGGCVEGAVYDLGSSAIESGLPSLHRFGVSDEDAFAVGLTCGGILDIFIQRIDAASFPQLGAVADDVEAGRPVAIATLVAHPDKARVGAQAVIRAEGLTGSLGDPRMDQALATDARGMLDSGATGALRYGAHGERLGDAATVLVVSFVPKPRLIVFGAIDFAGAMAEVGSFLGYQVTVCDARPIFATRSRFPSAAEVVVQWPHRYLSAEIAGGRIDPRTAICVLTHDPKFDIPLLEVALGLPDEVYVGAMGSRRTHEDRTARLREHGLTEAQIARLASPIGLDLGARTPEETAISIAGEIIARRWNASGQSLAKGKGPIHGVGREVVRAS